MCGRYSLIAQAEELQALFDLLDLDERLVAPRYNIAPTQPIIVVREGDKGREAVPIRWGLLPSWVKDPADFPLLINARAEGIAQKPAFRAAFKRRRCLVPASGFYEWQATGGKSKQPYWIAPEDGRLIAFAGLWETWIGGDGSEIDTAAIVTRDADAALQPIHHRMPVLIAPDDFDLWLSDSVDPKAAETLLTAAPEELLSAVPVSTRVNRVANDDAGLWEPVKAEPPDNGETARPAAKRPRKNKTGDGQTELF
ncbi:MAG TPA: SOS response-associated peptidase [Afifellaceae bacterium]|nr:SOS response-associated peptidase [Afifellaceae bacterium]